MSEKHIIHPGKVSAYTISVLFHPLLMAFYGTLLLLIINPYLFGVSHWQKQNFLLLLIFISTVLIPGIAIALMIMLGFVSGIHMRDKKDRIGPLIAVLIFYLWIFRNTVQNPELPQALSVWLLGVILAAVLCFIINTVYKVSLHGAGVGGLMMWCFFIYSIYSYDTFQIITENFVFTFNTFIIVIIGLLIAGLVGTSRLFLRTHTPDEFYSGFVVGMVAQCFSLFFIQYVWPG